MEKYLGSAQYSCGREDDVAIDDVAVGKGVIQWLPEYIEKYGAEKPLSSLTFKAAKDIRDKYVLSGMESGYLGRTGRKIV